MDVSFPGDISKLSQPKENERPPSAAVSHGWDVYVGNGWMLNLQISRIRRKKM